MESENRSNPQIDFIDLVVSQIEDDENLIEALGSGKLSLQDVERWRQQRWEAERHFLQESGRLIEEMKSQGFGDTMRRSSVEAALRPRRAAGGTPRFMARGRRRVRKQESEPYSVALQRFTLEMADLGLPCSLTLSGGYDEVLDAAIRILDGKEELREAVKRAITETPRTRLSPEERDGRRSEEQVSDEAANQTRSSGFPST